MSEYRAIKLRPITDSDLPFLLRVYASTREDELKPAPWSEEQKRMFLEQQFQAQHAHYQQHFVDATYDVILEDDQPIGRLYVDRREDEIRIIDIALIAEARGRQIGGRLLKGLLNEAREQELPVTIHVEMNNPAKSLYDRLGFVKIDSHGVYDLMKWTP